MIYGFIIAAGNQSRFFSKTPKALMKIDNETLLDKNIRVMSKFCDDIYTVVSNKNELKFKNYKRLIISSGFGCGDAVLKALTAVPYKIGDKCFIIWGDSYNTERIYESIPLNSLCAIPCVYEESPYVQLKEDGAVLFSKYGDNISAGYHDLSLFYFDIDYMIQYLKSFRNKICIDGKYIHKHNNEMQFLDVFNETAASYEIIPIDNYRAYCFNTIEEFNSMQQLFKK